MIRSYSLPTGPDSVFDSHFGALHFSAIPRIAPLLFHSDGNRNSFNLCFSFASSSSSCSSYRTIYHSKTRKNYVVASLASSDSLEASSFGVSETMVGVLGGGQLGRMLCQAACQMAIKVIILDPLEDWPASSLSHDHVVGNFDDSAAVQEFLKRCGVLTVEIEHVDAETLEILEQQGVDCQPKASTVSLIQEKYLQKVRFSQHAIPLPEFTQIDDLEGASKAGNVFGYPLMIKSKRLAYDGSGNAIAKREEDLYSAITAIGGFVRGLYVDKWVKFVKELSVIVVRGRDNSVLCYLVVESIHKENICHIVKAPATVSWEVRERATDVAFKTIRSLEGDGVFAVELFLIDDGQILLNEVAPRSHNSGHHTIESCCISQYEQYLWAVLGLPLGDTSMKPGAAIMYNILGEDEGEPGFHLANKLMKKALTIPGASVHWYNKPEMRKQRKMGHATIIGRSMKIVEDSLFSLLGEETPENLAVRPRVGIIMGSGSDYPVMMDAVEILQQFNVPYEKKIVSAHCTPGWMFSYASSARRRGLEIIIAGVGGAANLPGIVAAITSLPVIGVPIQDSALDGLDSLRSTVQNPWGVPVATVAINNSTNAGLLAVRMLGISDFNLCARMRQYLDDARNNVLAEANKFEKDHSSFGVRPRVGIIMGSKSDYSAMKTVEEILRQFNVPYEMKIVSAHRTPEWMFSYASSAHEQGLQIIIAGAGGAAHLPGMVAAITPLPVIGVPVRTSALDGLDSLLSIVQMPSGVPVAIVAINNSTNAGFLAVRMLGISDFDLCVRMRQYLDDIRNDVLAKADKLEKDNSSPRVRSRVGIITGSDSDFSVMENATKILEQFNVPYEIKIVSAHCTPDWMFSYASSAHEQGLKIIIVGAGCAAHLSGKVATSTPLPVIGVPVRASALKEQMPRGGPVATVAINNYTNAGLLAVRMLGISDFDLCARMSQYLDDARNVVLAKADKFEKNDSSPGVIPRVGIIMGSDSDYSVMKTVEEILQQFNVPCEIKIVSAHRTPDWMFSYASSARERGLEIVIAGAGGAAHLPGMVAAITPLPVIGVPVRSSILDGLDSLLSIVQMPRGVPVATVAINNSTYAGLLALRMLGIYDIDQCARMSQYLDLHSE